MASWTGKTGKARAKACREKAALTARAALRRWTLIKASYEDIAIEWREPAAQFEGAAWIDSPTDAGGSQIVPPTVDCR